MVKIYNLCKAHRIKELLKENLVDILKKKGKKILEIDLSKYSDKIESIKNNLNDFSNVFDYIIFYGDLNEVLAKECDIIIVFENQCLSQKILSNISNQVFIAFWDENILAHSYNIRSKIIDIGFLPTNTVNITHLSYEEDNKIDLSLFFQRSVVNINDDEIINQEINERYTKNISDEFIYFYPLLTALKVLLNLI